jgi:hypothetical protein
MPVIQDTIRLDKPSPSIYRVLTHTPFLLSSTSLSAPHISCLVYRNNFAQKHSVDMVIQQPQSAKPFSVDKINFNVHYKKVQWKWLSWGRECLSPSWKNYTYSSSHIHAVSSSFTYTWSNNFMLKFPTLLQLDTNIGLIFTHTFLIGKKIHEMVIGRMIGSRSPSNFKMLSIFISPTCAQSNW